MSHSEGNIKTLFSINIYFNIFIPVLQTTDIAALWQLVWANWLFFPKPREYTPYTRWLNAIEFAIQAMPCLCDNRYDIKNTTHIQNTSIDRRVKCNAPINQKASPPSNQINFVNALPLWSCNLINHAQFDFLELGSIVRARIIWYRK